jgi:hypothetical protein
MAGEGSAPLRKSSLVKRDQRQHDQSSVEPEQAVPDKPLVRLEDDCRQRAGDDSKQADEGINPGIDQNGEQNDQPG